MRTLLTTALGLLVLILPAQAAGPGAGNGVEATESSPLVVAPYDLPLVQQALEAQAWVVLTAAETFARENQGVYPENADAFVAWLPRGERMQNLLTGETNVPSDAIEAPPGTIVYRPIVWEGHRVGGEVIAIGWRGERTNLVTDLGWWKRTRPVDVTLAR